MLRNTNLKRNQRTVRKTKGIVNRSQIWRKPETNILTKSKGELSLSSSMLHGYSLASFKAFAAASVAVVVLGVHGFERELNALKSSRLPNKDSTRSKTFSKSWL